MSLSAVTLKKLEMPTPSQQVSVRKVPRRTDAGLYRQIRQATVMVTHDIFDSYMDGFTQIYYLANGETLEAGFYDDLMNKKGEFYNIKEAMSKNNTSAG